MKKSFIYIAMASLAVLSCKNESMGDTTPVVEASDISTQNSNDDAAIRKYMDEHYLDSQGNIKVFSTTDASDDNMPKLSAMNPQKLASGVTVIIRPGAQPDPGTAIGATDVLRIMQKSTAFLSANENGTVSYTSEISFSNPIESTGVPEVDPSYYYVKEAVLTSSGKGRSYFEIEGLQEGLKLFKSFNKADSEGYNLQGVIIVPSRAAFARDEHNPYNFTTWRNRNFVFNFQVYKSTPRTAAQK